ncbi:MAG: lytic murein transglycosylase [Actinomycetota bacterium]|nr:lytic murein transglycosylase [Actinomycetota bacterium]
MNRRKLLTLAATAGACTAGMAALVMPASAELRTLTVTLLGGQQVTVTVDVPPGTPLDQIQIPGISTPIVSVEDSGPAPTPTADPSPAPTQAPAPAPSGAPSGDGSSEPSASPGGASRQETARPGAGRAGSKGRGSTRRRGGKANAQVVLEGVVDPLVSADGTRRGSRAKVDRDNEGRLTDGTPTLNNPSFSLATPGAAPIGVPNFFIEKFRIPPFLLPIYQAAGIQYGVRWELLAAINEVETDYGRNLNVSSAGALGWMQFMPATWKMYGVDANRDGVKDPYNPVDAIFAAARYLRAAGAEKDVSKAVFAYNHADWYVDMVLMRARLIGGLPADLVGSLTGLTQGRFPVYAKATYADDLSEREMTKRRKRGQNAAYLVESEDARRGINIYARRGAPVIAANDGKVIRIGSTKRLGRFLQLQDVYGNTFTYAHLGKVAERYPAPKPTKVTPAQVAKELELPKADPKPTKAASAGKKAAARAVPGKERLSARRSSAGAAPAPSAPQTPASDVVEAAKERLFANPMRPDAQDAGGAQQVFEAGGDVPGVTTVEGLSRLFGLDRKDVQLKTLKVGSKVAAGTILGRIGANTRRGMAPHVLFETRPAGRGAPRIDPKPILDGWKLLESTAIYRAAGKNPFFGRDAVNPSIGQILLMSKDALAQRVINNPRIELYECGRRDIETSQIDRRVLATLEFLAASGLKPTVTSLRCGHSYLTASGNVSHHSSGNAVDIAKVNGIPIIGNQGKGSVTEITVQRLLTLQGTMKPDQIISLMKFKDTDNTYAMGDHDDHIHVGWQPMYGTNAKLAKQVNAALKPKQWIKLIDRLGSIDNPTVRTKPSQYSLKVKKRASHAHRGE